MAFHWVLLADLLKDQQQGFTEGMHTLRAVGQSTRAQTI